MARNPPRQAVLRVLYASYTKFVGAIHESPVNTHPVARGIPDAPVRTPDNAPHQAPLCKGRETRPLRCRTRCDSSRRGRVTRPLYAPPICTAPSPPFKGDGCERRRWRIQRATRSGSGQNSVSECEQRILGTATGGHRGVASFDTGECA